MDNRTVLTDYVRRMTAALMMADVKSVVISPGSRSTPLAYAFASTEDLDVYMQVDERSAAYFALGLAKASGNPVVLLCTSGTAASNYHPAITEAYYARIPLIVITADRPHELREVGAPQAIDQIRMYGEHVKYSVDFPLAEKNPDIDDFIDRHVSRALSVATSAPRGPVHLNVPFREPLLIDFDLEPPKSTFQKRIKSADCLDASTAQQISQLLAKAEKGFIIAGEMPIGFDKVAFWKFAKALEWPVLCDPLSNLRTEVPEQCLALCIDHYDALLKSDVFKEKAAPDTVIRFGAQPVAKPLSLYLKKVRPATVIAVDESPEFRDSLGVVTHHIQTSCETVMQIIVDKPKTSYTELWTTANAAASMITNNHKGVAGDEGIFAKMLFAYLPTGSDLVSGSSMPIRDVDTFFRKTNKDITIFANRGTNGIDGVVSTAFGVQAARKRPTWLLIGDLSFLHDVNGLIVTRFHEADLTIVIINNDGGGIFSYLPQAEAGNHFEELFGTPTGLTFGHIAAMYDAQYSAIHTPEEFEMELVKAKEKPVRIIEVFTNRQANVKAHRDLWTKITDRLDHDE
ncbi:2-succinyl-5-enolpyruvyl-6-hydroxy-3-cyclohexene-1-carboxylic-acid synthase [Sporosarcina sp. ANT_H38]|uniref:2-succinyl-5-enolpyruvyl-6-hydroxy-3- cyclohexene-1-carboxylic-acid synthase n=1 Tax=Sporosarcina sp. ANT_H38 TaxID=2597358 RepID=UPI0011F35C7A|nr:2-succinyl-5-enolpyruvyl-6-hydroxy-3-cyclohexene-1-carboxylic-acid synthase [Sporosarcina sp. ANT_H38]KAA0964789.1 2-succinyl-5-enolpyruvyl-6-hydroxy-3-cyclohexene-1-carboxylic-acid synthase [Sporosarcina sp. ANT_H38]